MGDDTQTQTTQSTRRGYDPALAQADTVLSRAGQLAGDQSIWTPTQSTGTRTGIDQLAQIGQQGSAALGGLTDVFNGGTQGFGVGMHGLTDTANGVNLNNRAPGFQQALDNASQNTAEDVQRAMAGDGRLGSAANTRTLTDRIGQLRTSAEVGNYNQERGYQNQAQGQLTQIGMGAAGLSGQVQGAQQFGADASLRSGAMTDAFDYANRMRDVNANNYLQGVAFPGANLGGTQDGTTTTTQESDPTGMIAGGVMTGIGVLSGNPMLAMGGLGQMTGGGGMGIGGMGNAGSGMNNAGWRSTFPSG
jgi:hypothetical protein